jgi:hypothetical protein
MTLVSPIAAFSERRARAFYPPAYVETLSDFREVVWARRECFICGVFGPCKHREVKAIPMLEYWRIQRVRAEEVA